MTGRHSRISGLQRLVDDHGVDVRTTVLRVATDLFCQSNTHSLTDIARYSELALALLKTADAATRRTIAGKLAKHPHAPERVLQELINDPDVTVASQVLEYSPAFERADISAFLVECGVAEAAALARRNDLTRDAICLLAAHESDLVVEALLENRQLLFDAAATRLLVKRTEDRPELIRLLLAHPGGQAAELSSLYPQASAEKRREIREALVARRAARPVAVPISALTSLNEAVRSGNRAMLSDALAKALHLDPDRMDRVLDDPTGEIFALALLAAGIKRAPAINVLLIAGTIELRTSVERIFAAADLLDETPRPAARQIVAAVVGEKSAAPLFDPHMHDSATPQRSAQPQRRPLRPGLPMRRTEIS